MENNKDNSDVAYEDFIQHYEKWVNIYRLVGMTAPNGPVRDGRRLHLRFGYPNEGWSGYIIEETSGGYNVYGVTTERRNEPSESLKGFFACIEDAGKYVIWNLGENLRVSCRVDPVGWSWEDMELDPRVEWVSIAKFVSKYVLESDPSRYFILQAGGVQPENRLLPLTYDELDMILMAGLPGI